MRALVLRVIDAIRRRLAGPEARVAHPEPPDHPQRTTWNLDATSSRTEITA